MSETLYVLFAGENYYPRGGIKDKLEHTYGRSDGALEGLVERARGYAKTSDFFFKVKPQEMIGVECQPISWWHIIEFSSRGIVIVAQGQLDGRAETWEEDFTEEFA